MLPFVQSQRCYFGPIVYVLLCLFLLPMSFLRLSHSVYILSFPILPIDILLSIYTTSKFAPCYHLSNPNVATFGSILHVLLCLFLLPMSFGPFSLRRKPGGVSPLCLESLERRRGRKHREGFERKRKRGIVSSGSRECFSLQGGASIVMCV